MKPFLVVLVLACLVSLAPVVAADDPPPSSPGASCRTYYLPGDAYVQRCDGSYLVGLPDLP